MIIVFFCTIHKGLLLLSSGICHGDMEVIMLLFYLAKAGSFDNFNIQVHSDNYNTFPI